MAVTPTVDRTVLNVSAKIHSLVMGITGYRAAFVRYPYEVVGGFTGFSVIWDSQGDTPGPRCHRGISSQEDKERALRPPPGPCRLRSRTGD